MDDLELRLRRAYDEPHARLDVEALIARSHQGARRRRRRRVAGVAGVIVAVLGAGALLGRAVLDRADAPPVIDEPTAQVTVGSGPCCIAVVQGQAWVLNRSDRTLQGVATDGQRATRAVPVDADVMTAAGDRLVLTDTQSGSSVLLDPATGRRTPIVGFSSRGNAAYDGRHLWLGSASSGRLARVDPATGRVLEVSTIRGVPSFDSMAFTDDGVLWATTWEGELLKVDLDSRRVTSRREVFPDNTDYVAIVATGGRVLAVSGGTPRLLVLDDRGGEELARRDLEISGGPSITEQPDGSVWLTRGPEVIDELDPRTGERRTTYRVPLGSDGAHLGGAVATGAGSLWVTVWPDGDAPGRVVRFPVGVG